MKNIQKKCTKCMGSAGEIDREHTWKIYEKSIVICRKCSGDLNGNVTKDKNKRTRMLKIKIWATEIIW